MKKMRWIMIMLMGTASALFSCTVHTMEPESEDSDEYYMRQNVIAIDTSGYDELSDLDVGFSSYATEEELWKALTHVPYPESDRDGHSSKRKREEESTVHLSVDQENGSYSPNLQQKKMRKKSKKE